MKTKTTLALLFLVCWLQVPSALAANKTWNGGAGNGTWTAPLNWGGTAPVANDSLFFAGSTQLNGNNTFTANTEFNGLTFNSGASAFTLAGNAINLGGNITNNSTNGQTINLATILVGDIATNVNSTGNIWLSGMIAGNQTITVNGGAGAVATYIGGASRNSFQGTFQVNGILAANSNMNVAGAEVNLGSAGTFDMRGNRSTVAGLVGSAGSSVTSSSATNRALTIGGSGNYTFGGVISNGASGITSLWVAMNYRAQSGGVQTLSANNTFNGTTTIDSGTLVLDYSSANGGKLNSSSLTFRAGTIELVGGNYTENVGNMTIAGTGSVSGGMVNITRTSGSSVLQIGTIAMGDYMSNGSGALNFSASNIATTTDSNVVNGILTNSANGAARITVGGADWATKSVNDIVAYSGYTAFVTSGGTNTLNYVLNGGSTLTGNVNFNTLKIASSTGSAQTLAMGNRTLGLGRSGLLLTGTDDYSITASAGGGLGDVILHQYNTGNLTLGPTAGRLEHAGTGKTILTGASSATTNNATNALMLDSGTVQFSNNNQFAGNGNLLLFSGRLVADTSGGDISLTNNSAGGFRTVALGSDVPVIDVIGGGTLTIGGLIQTNYANPNQFASPLVFGSAETNGTFVVTGNNTYNGDTRLAGGKVSINSATSLGNSTASNPSYKVVFSGNSTLNTTADITSARYLDINSGVTGTIETSANTTLTQNGTVAGAGNLNKSGAGTLTLSATNIYTGVTTISAGTLILDATGTTTCSSGVNLGTAASQGTLNLTAKSAFAFGTGQAVSGYGTINIGTGKTVTVAGNLAPCTSSPGIIGVTGGLAMSATTATTMALAGIGGTAGTDFDKISVSDGLAYAGTLSIVSFSGFNINQANTYALFNFASYTGNFNSVSVGGFGLTFDTIKTWNGTNGGNTYSFALDTGILSVVPEPSTWVLLAFSLTTAMILRRRRAI